MQCTMLTMLSLYYYYSYIELTMLSLSYLELKSPCVPFNNNIFTKNQYIQYNISCLDISSPHLLMSCRCEQKNTKYLKISKSYFLHFYFSIPISVYAQVLVFNIFDLRLTKKLCLFHEIWSEIPLSIFLDLFYLN